MPASARLRGLRLVGFKSFAEKTTVEFGPGISAVVGPNGSGKSNLADAIRWALGEQGRSLRTRKSEDVVFAGSASRHATGMADVTLVIDNEDRLLPVDYAEVDLGRRLYRSGENEYLLNRTRVRLRDLQDLLAEANLSDNAFLFIGQGMVDQALSLRPEERRPLFEEVAGVRRHERRRRAAEGQLAEAESNLARVRDILGELRPRARRLAAQAEQEAARQTAGEDLAAALVAAARTRWFTAERAAAAASAAVSEWELSTDRHMGALRAAEEDAAALARTLAARADEERSARRELDARRAATVDLRLVENRVTAELSLARRDAERLEAERAVLSSRVTEARSSLAAPAVSIDDELRDELVQAEAQLAALLGELSEIETEAAGRSAQEQAAQRAAAARVAEREGARRRLVELERQLAEQRARAEQATATHDEATARLAAASRELELALGREREADGAADAARSALDEVSGRTEALAARASATHLALETARGRLATLDGKLAADEGGGLIARARRRGGIRLTEGLEIEPSLRRAAEAALGDALRGVALARGELEAVRGEAGVVVLRDAITAASVDPAEVDGAGGPTLTMATRLRELGGGLLVDAIRQDPSRAVRHLLATAVWAPDLEAALSIAEVLPAGWLVATLDGELVRGNGLVRLGGAGGSLLECQAARDSAAAELEQLRQTAKEAADAADAAATETDRGAVALAAARAVLDDVQRARRAAETQERTAAGHEEAARREQAWEDAQLARLVSLTDRVRADLPADGENEGFGWARAGATSAPPPTDAAPDELAHVRARAEELRRRRDGLREQAGRSESERRRSDDERRRIEVRLGLDEARLLELEDQSGRLAETAERARTELGQVTAALASAREEERSASELLDELDRSEAADRTRLVELEQAAAKAREALRAAEERSRAEERRELERRLQLEQIGEQLLVELAALGDLGLAAIEAEVAVPASPGAAHAEGAAKPAAASEPAGLEAPDAEEALGPAEALASELEAIFPVVTAAWRALGENDQATVDLAGGAGAQLATLRRRYQTLGVSNPFAAREYAEIKARVDELDGQESDLTEAIAATRQLISELSALVAKQFLDTFTKLEGAFARRFEGLFGGGDASLTLTDPTDLSVTGVEITARPPGKKRQALAMLSGGERTLTAVALLFAMLEIRPVPFCVLDEVDAALDEANVGRFVAALRELAELTQFVVITHNRGTIEAADALYGVTMGEDAVSRVISLRLSSGIDLPAPTPAMATSA